jgi:hypothetical protein
MFKHHMPLTRPSALKVINANYILGAKTPKYRLRPKANPHFVLTPPAATLQSQSKMIALPKGGRTLGWNE